MNIMLSLLCSLGTPSLPYCKDVDTGPDLPDLFPTSPCIPIATTPATPSNVNMTQETSTQTPVSISTSAKMSKTPTAPIKPPFSPELKLRCSLRDSGIDVAFIESITVSNQMGIVALIALQRSARLESNATNTAVVGDIAGPSQGYLELAITYPTREQAGDYQCQINTIGTDGGFVQVRVCVKQ